MVREVVRTESLKGRRGRLSSKAKASIADPTMSSSVTLLSILSKASESTEPLLESQVRHDPTVVPEVVESGVTEIVSSYQRRTGFW